MNIYLTQYTDSNDGLIYAGPEILAKNEKEADKIALRISLPMLRVVGRLIKVGKRRSDIESEIPGKSG